MADFYDGGKLLSLKTLSGGDPELYFCCGNRTAGKTFYFKRLLMRRFVKTGAKFAIFVRQIDDVKGRVDSFFADIGPIAFPGASMRQKPLLKGKAAELLYVAREGGHPRPCGYVIPLKFVRPIKESSALFADAAAGFFDEFQDEDGKYIKNEIHNFNNIRVSIARGGAAGVHARPFPVYLCSNNVSVFNPFFDYFHIASRLEPKARYIRGDCWVLEQTFNPEAAEAIRANFAGMSERELEYAAGRQYLKDDRRYVREVKGQKTPVINFIHQGKLFGLWRLPGGVHYVSDKYSDGLPVALSFTLDDHDEGDIMIPQASPLVKSLRNLYMSNNVVFASQRCKHAYLDVCTLIR